MSGANHGFYAFDKEDKFLKTPWYVHIGVAATSFAVGSGIGMFEKNPSRVFETLGINNSTTLKYSTNAVVRILGASLEFWSTKQYQSYTSKEYGDKNLKNYRKYWAIYSPHIISHEGKIHFFRSNCFLMYAKQLQSF
jgi:hypothetical protein